MYPILEQREGYIATIYPVGRISQLLATLTNLDGPVVASSQDAKNRLANNKRAVEKSLAEYLGRLEKDKLQGAARQKIESDFLKVLHFFKKDHVSFVAQAYCDARLKFSEELFYSKKRRNILVKYFEKRFSLGGEVKTQFYDLLLNLLFSTPTEGIVRELPNIQADLDQFGMELNVLTSCPIENISGLVREIIGKDLYELLLAHGHSCTEALKKYKCRELASESRGNFAFQGLFNDYSLTQLDNAMSESAKLDKLLKNFSNLMLLMSGSYTQLKNTDRLSLFLDLLNQSAARLYLETGFLDLLGLLVNKGELNFKVFGCLNRSDSALVATLKAEVAEFDKKESLTGEEQKEFVFRLILHAFSQIFSNHTSKLVQLGSELDSVMCHRVFQMLEERRIQSPTLENSHNILMESAKTARKADQDLILELEKGRKNWQEKIQKMSIEQKKKALAELGELFEEEEKEGQVKPLNKDRKLLEGALVFAQCHLLQDAEVIEVEPVQKSEKEIQSKNKKSLSEAQKPSSPPVISITTQDDMHIICLMMADDLEPQLKQLKKWENSLESLADNSREVLAVISAMAADLKNQIDKVVPSNEISHREFNTLNKKYEEYVRKFDDLYAGHISLALKKEKEELKREQEDANITTFVNEVLRRVSAIKMEEGFGRGEWIDTIPVRSSYSEIREALHNRVIQPKDDKITVFRKKRLLAPTEKMALFVTQRSSTPGAQFCISIHRWVVKQDIGHSAMNNLSFVNRKDWQDMQVLPGAPLSFYVFHVRDTDRR